MFRLRVRSILFVLVPIFIVCGFGVSSSCKLNPAVVSTSNQSAETASPPVQSSINTDDWKRTDVKVFSFSLPPGMKKKDVRGIDSIVWKYADDSMELVIDLGPYSGKPGIYELKPEYGENQVEIGGKSGTVIFFRSDEPNDREQPYFAAAYFSGVDAKGAKVSFTVRSKSSRGQEVAKAIFGSIKFPAS